MRHDKFTVETPNGDSSIVVTQLTSKRIAIDCYTKETDVVYLAYVFRSMKIPAIDVSVFQGEKRSGRIIAVYESPIHDNYAERVMQPVSDAFEHYYEQFEPRPAERIYPIT